MSNLLTVYMLKCIALRTKVQEAKPWPLEYEQHKKGGVRKSLTVKGTTRFNLLTSWI